MKEPSVSKILRVTLYFVFVAGIIGTITLPFMLETYTLVLYDAYYLQPGYRLFILTFLMVVAVLGLWVVWELIRIMQTVTHDPFVSKNVGSLRRIGFLVMTVSALFFLKCLYYVTFLTIACGFLFIVCGLFAFTLCSLFRQAVAFKEENDLTI